MVFLLLRMRRPSARRLSCQLLFGPLCPVLGPSLLTICNSDGIQRTPHYVIAHTREILHSSAADEHDGVLLQVVSNSRNVGSHFHSVRKPDPRDFPESRVRLLRRRGIYPDANAPLLRAAPERGTLGLYSSECSAFSHKLTNSRHENYSL